MNCQPLFARRTAHLRPSAVRELLKLTARPGVISFAGGLPAPELFPLDDVRAATERVMQQHGASALQYGETEGIGDLRDWVAAQYSRPHFQVQRENVMIVTGSQQALDLIGKVFLDPGDRVLVENPTYLAALSAWRPLEPTFVPVASDAEGINTQALPSQLEQGAKLLYVIPNYQNPQGTTLSLTRRIELVGLLRNRSTLLVEDNPYGELSYEGAPLPHLLELDASNDAQGGLDTNVIHLGTFSKVLTPGLRVGFVIAPGEVINKLVQAKQAADLHTSTWCQYLVLELIRNGTLERQIPRLRIAYKARRDAMLAALEAYFPDGVTWTRPAGGMFLMVTLPGHLAASAVLQEALAQDVAFVPGDDFHLNGCGRNTFRLNFSNANTARIEEGVGRLGRILKGKLPGK